MKKLIAATCVALGMTGAAWAADPAVGTWQTQVDDGAYAYIKMVPCGAAICGNITRTFNATGEYKSANIGKPLVWDMTPEGGGNYGSGKIWQPSKDKVYKSKMTLSGDTLNVSGCFGPICKKQTWSRVK